MLRWGWTMSEHRLVGSAEHNVAVSAFHGYCRICVQAWPCETQQEIDKLMKESVSHHERRQVEYQKYNYQEKKWETFTGSFNQWGIESEEVEGRVLNNTVAIIERTDGQVIIVETNRIKFL